LHDEAERALPPPTLRADGRKAKLRRLTALPRPRRYGPASLGGPRESRSRCIAGLTLRIVEETAMDLEAYETVPMTLRVRSIYRIVPKSEGYELIEEAVATPWVKDYQQFDEDRPTNLAKQYDFSNRGIFAAYDGE